MTRKTLIKKTIDNLSKLPDQKLKEVSDFVEFLLEKTEDTILTEGIKRLANQAKTFKFLEEDDDLYTVNDLKELICISQPKTFSPRQVLEISE